jgi:hypothetical protein
MSGSKYDLQGLHARVYIARETNGRLGKYQPLSPAGRSSNSVCAVLTLLVRCRTFLSPSLEEEGVRHWARVTEKLHPSAVHSHVLLPAGLH